MSHFHYSPLTCTVLQDAVFFTETGIVCTEKCLLPQQHYPGWFMTPTLS